MLLTKVTVGPFKSIEQPQEVDLDPAFTVLVGMNEAGKTAFLQALHKSRSVDGSDEFDPVSDYPRRSLTAYLKAHNSGSVAEATVLTYTLTKEEIDEINADKGTALPLGWSFLVHHKYDNTVLISQQVDEKPVVQAMLTRAALSSDAKKAAAGATGLRDLAERLSTVERTDADDAFLTELTKRNSATKWESPLRHELWNEFLLPNIPRFLYFDDYHLLPGKINLADLTSRQTQSKANKATTLGVGHRGILALLRMADIDVADLADPDGYESIKAKLEGISNTITDQVFQYWKQNENLEVEFDIRADPTEEAPYNNGPNLYIRIRNKRHRVTVPFDQRSKGFIWFFSFLVWFDSVQQQVRDPNGEIADLVLLLDEPGLSLHALAQADFLAYIDGLSDKHQVLYTTHSPFMVRSDRLDKVRVVEDREAVGTTISASVSGSNARTLFPLQAALGYTIAQNLFISKRNLLVEGPADLVYLQFANSQLEASGRAGLRNDIIIVPTGGLDKVVTFVALLGANQLEVVVLHDSTGSPDARLLELVRAKILSQRVVLTYADADPAPPVKKGAAKQAVAGRAADVEDMFTVQEYVSFFNKTFATALPKPLTEGDLPPGDRIVDRINRYLKAAGIQLRPSGGFNHYAVASRLASSPPTGLEESTLRRFSELFAKINALFSTPDPATDDDVE